MPDETLWMVSKSRSRGREENYGQAQVIELRGKNVCVCVCVFFSWLHAMNIEPRLALLQLWSLDIQEFPKF